MAFSQSFFAERFGVTERDLEGYLSEALSAGGDYADLYFEYLATTSLGMDEGILKSASEGVTLGVGIRVLAGERTGYAYSDDLSPEKIRKAARVAACIARGPATITTTGFKEANKHDLYPMLATPNESALAERVELVRRAEAAGRASASPAFHGKARYGGSLRPGAFAIRAGRLRNERPTT